MANIVIQEANLNGSVKKSSDLSGSAKIPTMVRGLDGDTPYIGENGNWWIREEDTGNPASGSIRTYVDCKGEPVILTIEDRTIYSITNCSVLTIALPETENYFAHLFIRFVDEGVVGLTMPNGVPVYGMDPELVEIGDIWEVSIDSVGGIMCLRMESYG